MNSNKILALALGLVLVAGLAGALVQERRIAALEADLTGQTARAEKAEARVTALQAAAEYRETQLFALQGQAEQCEQARSRDAADAVDRRDILEAAREQARRSASGAATPPSKETKGETAHDAARRAVADRLNRPL